MKKKSKQLLPEDEVPVVHVIAHSLGSHIIARALSGREVGLTFDPDLKIVRAEVKIQIEEQSAEQLRQPPALGGALLVLFCPKNRARHVMGDLEEIFNEDINTKGKRRAKLLYWAAVLRSIGPLLWVKVRKAGFIALLLEIGRWSGLS